MLHAWFIFSAPGKLKAMGQVLSKAREQLYDCKLVTGKLRAMLQTADEQVRSLKKQSTFLSQLAAKTVPNGIHCLSMRLTIDYYLLPLEKRKFPRSEDLENPNLYHYALFSDNVLAASVVVNSTIMNAKVLQTYYFVIPILLISQIKKKNYKIIPQAVFPLKNLFLNYIFVQEFL